MDQEDDYDGLFVVSVDELGNAGVWASVRTLLESRCTLHNLTLHNKVGRAVPVERLSLQFVPSGDRRLQRLRPFAHSPVVWFRHPYAHLLLVSTADASEYRNVIKPSLKRAISELERDWGGPPAPGPPAPQPSGMGALLGGGAPAPQPVGVLGAEWLIAYMRPVELDVADKAARKVYEKLKDDFGGRGRTRVLRLDLAKGYPTLLAGAGAFGAPRGAAVHGPAAGFGAGNPLGAGPSSSSAVTGLDELEVCLRDCVRSSFDARQAAYMAEVQRLANERRDPNWSFASLYLVKDSLALLLEGCGLHLDAYKEYVELEAAYQETLERRPQSAGSRPEADVGDSSGPQGDTGDAYGANSEAAEVATLISASWRATRRSILKRGAVQEFQFRQYLFASQARLLLRLGRPVDVAERGLRFIGATSAELGRRERLALGGVRPMLKEAWSFTACLAVISSVTASVYGRDAAGGQPPSAAAGNAPASHAADPTGSPAGREPAGAATSSATRSARAASSPYGPGQPPASPASLRGRSNATGPAIAAAFPDVDEDASDMASWTGAASAASAAAQQAAPLVSDAASGSEHVDWQLWLPFEAEVPTLDPSALCGQAIAPTSVSASKSSPDDSEAPLRQATFQAYMLALAHLYNTACSALLSLASRAVALISESLESAAGSGSPGGASIDEWTSLLQAWRDGLRNLPAHYQYRGVVGMFVDQEEDRQFEATPQQQGTPLQLLRQAISALHAAGDGGNGFAAQPAQQSPQGAIITPRSEVAPVHSIWLTPQATGAQLDFGHGVGQHYRAESLHSISMGAATSAAGGGASASAAGIGGTDSCELPGGSSWGTARPGSSSGAGAPGHRPQVSWAAEPETLGAPGAGTRGRHQHSSSADNVSGSVFAKFDACSRQASSVVEPLRSQRSGLQGQAPPRLPGTPSPLAVEGQVDTARSSVSTLGAHAGAEHHVGPAGAMEGAVSAEDSASASATTLLPPELEWLRDRRLRLALSSPRHCADLALHLALAAASCFSRAGRQRAAAQVFADVGAVLLERGQAEVAANLMEHVVTLAQAEGWHALLGRALPVLMAAQQAIGHVMLPYTCVGYLSLPAHACQPEVRRRVLELMLSTAGCASPAPGPRQPPPVSAVLQLGTEKAILAALLPGSTSKFYGTQCGEGTPSLVPPARKSGTAPERLARGSAGVGAGGSAEDDAQLCAAGSAPARGAAQLLCVGDVCTLQLQLYSNLPAAVCLKDMHLVLGTLQGTQQPLAAQHQAPVRAGPRAQAAAAALAQRTSSFGYGRTSLLPLQAEQQAGPQQQQAHPHVPSAVALPQAQGPIRNLSGGDVALGTGAAAPQRAWVAKAGPQGGAASLPALSQATLGDRPGGADLVASQPFSGWDPRLQQQSHLPQPQQQYPGSAPALVFNPAPATPYSPASAAGLGPSAGAAGGPTAGGPSRLAAARPSPENTVPNASSSASLAPAAVAAASSFGNLSDASGVGKRAPSWPDALSAAASMTQLHGSAAGFGSAFPTTSSGVDAARPSRNAQDLSAGGPLSPASTQGGGAPGWLAGDDLACHHLLQVTHIQGPAGVPGRAGAAGEANAAAAAVDPRVIVLQPGLTQLTFRVAPTAPGLYFVRHVSATLGSYDLRIPVLPAQQLERDLHALSGGRTALPGRQIVPLGPNGAASTGFAFGGLGLGGAAGGAAAAIAALGQVADGEVRHLDVALQVAPLLPRLLVAPVAVGGALIAGLPQWLGVCLSPLDTGACERRDADASPGRSAPESPAGRPCSGGDGGDDLTHARVHVQTRTQSGLRIGEWPPPSLHTPAAPLSAMQSLSGAPPCSMVPELSDPHQCGPGPSSAFANAAAAAAAGVHSSLAPAHSHRRHEAAGTCRVAVVTLRKVPANGTQHHQAKSAAAHRTADTPRADHAAVASAVSPGGTNAPGASGVCWTYSSSRHGIDLSQALGDPLRSSVLLWLPVWVPPVALGADDNSALSAPPELVRVQQAHAGVAWPRIPHGGGAVQRPNARVFAPGPSHAHGPGRGLTAGASACGSTPSGPRPLGSTEVEVVVEGLRHGVWRSHASALSVPLQQPFQVRTTAHQLPDMRVLVSVAMTSNLLLPVVIAEVALEPQYGLVLSWEPATGPQPHAAVPGLLPLRMAPGGTASWAFLLSRSEQALPVLPSVHKDDACILHVSFGVVPGAGAPLAAVVAGTATGQLPEGPHFLPPPVALHGGLPVVREAGLHETPAGSAGWASAGQPLPSATASGACPNVYSHSGAYSGAGSYEAAAHSASGGLNFSHGFVLEFPTNSALTHNLVSVRLLGPHSGVLGQPVQLAWLVTRVSAPPAAPSTGPGGADGGSCGGTEDGVDVAAYEVVEAAEARGAPGGFSLPALAPGAFAPNANAGEGPHRQWRQGVGCRGSVQLGRAKGSVAVVEAVVVPLAVGILQGPTLRLRGLKEVRNDEAGVKEYIAVSGA